MVWICILISNWVIRIGSVWFWVLVDFVGLVVFCDGRLCNGGDLVGLLGLWWFSVVY